MKRILILGTILAIATLTYAQSELTSSQKTSTSMSRFSLGVRGGVASFMQKAEGAQSQLGFDALLDFQYAYYGCLASEHKVGLLVGVSAGYARAGLKMDAIQDQYTTSTTDGDICYTIAADNLVEKQGAVVLEIPLMFSFVSKQGVFLNVGPRFQLPVYSHYALRFDNPNVDAYFTKERVHVQNELITGNVNHDNAKGTFNAPKFNLLLGLELGYEWQLRNNDALGLGAYANYGVYSMYRNDSEAQSIIDITAPSAQVQPAQINYQAAQDVYGTGMGFFDAGVKVTYHFNFQ
ncbi:MAG: hypothetical protein MJZ65_03695 [Paludibacteraceae bacterium]|nr:hypothetical protein [Paludibacteraceae bacterium]